jgi:ABC-type oligopeptide transport system substrate-binding subunit
MYKVKEEFFKAVCGKSLNEVKNIKASVEKEDDETVTVKLTEKVPYFKQMTDSFQIPKIDFQNWFFQN